VISTDNGGYDWTLYHDDGTWRVFTGTNWVDTGLPVDVNQWQHVAAVFDPAYGVRFYKGIRAFSTPEIGFEASTAPAAIGQNPGFGGYFQGTIDEVAIWNRPLSAEEIRSRLYRPLTGGEIGLLAYYRCDETGDVLLNSSPAGSSLDAPFPAEPAAPQRVDGGPSAFCGGDVRSQPPRAGPGGG